jgi:hypothetical protein
MEIFRNLHPQAKYLAKRGGVAGLAKASFVHPRDLGTNLSIDKKYFLLCLCCI